MWSVGTRFLVTFHHFKNREKKPSWAVGIPRTRRQRFCIGRTRKWRRKEFYCYHTRITIRNINPFYKSTKKIQVSSKQKTKNNGWCGKTDWNRNRKVGDTFHLRCGDPDYNSFLFSLFPGLKKVPESRKLHAQTRMQQVLLEEQQYFPERRGNYPEWSDSSAASSDCRLSYFRWPSTAVTHVESNDETASRQRGWLWYNWRIRLHSGNFVVSCRPQEKS